jgi:hypothetical protein
MKMQSDTQQDGVGQMDDDTTIDFSDEEVEPILGTIPAGEVTFADSEGTVFDVTDLLEEIQANQKSKCAEAARAESDLADALSYSAVSLATVGAVVTMGGSEVVAIACEVAAIYYHHLASESMECALDPPRRDFHLITTVLPTAARKDARRSSALDEVGAAAVNSAHAMAA